MGTKRVTLRVAEIANRHAEELLRDELEAEERENQRKAEEEALEEALQNPPAEGQSTDTVSFSQPCSLISSLTQELVDDGRPNRARR